MSQPYPASLPVSLDTDTSTEALYSKVAWRIIPLLCVCYIAAYLDKINIGFAKLQMQSDLGFSETVYGLGAGLFFIGYMLFEVPSNLVLQRMGAKVWIARIMITWGLISACMMLVTTPTQFYVLRFLLGVAEAGFYPGVMLYITFWFPTFRRGKIMALFLLGIPLSSMIGGPLSGWILSAFDGVQSMSGWQWMFLLEAIPSVLLGLLILMYLPNGVQDAKWLDSGEKKVLLDTLQKDQSSQSHTSVREAFASARVWLLGVVDIFLMMAVYGLNFWLPTLIRDSGVSSNTHIGLLTGVSSILAVAALVLNGMSSDKHRERRWHIALPAFLAAGSIWASTFFSLDPVITVVLFSLANIGLMATFPVFWCIPSTFLAGRAAAAGIALIASLSTLGGIGATYLMGILKDLTQSSETGLIMFAVCLVAAGLLILLLPKHVVNR
ncbi:MFS transporter [Paenalcaligenes niemegkensis]|uniref:MFS transporter n=1 Tax=Paenalcaligenes niemegkensis TaxID=2895469 RepID=UPI001EE877C9|nr:MFS transporter [Paenalcaligenes niemegkensis]MCQ9616109.1 MFS transporter [Paenalcaligenes niemegkensis]